jgi:acyl carrier protein
MTPTPEDVMLALPGLLLRLCKQSQPGLTRETSLEDVAGLDSMRILQVVALLEEHFHVEVDEVALHDLHTLGDIVDAITSGRPA